MKWNHKGTPPSDPEKRYLVVYCPWDFNRNQHDTHYSRFDVASYYTGNGSYANKESRSLARYAERSQCENRFTSLSVREKTDMTTSIMKMEVSSGRGSNVRDAAERQTHIAMSIRQPTRGTQIRWRCKG